MQLLTIENEDERELAVQILRQLDRVGQASDRYDKVASTEIHANSILADDDRRTSWLQLSHFVDVCLLFSQDQLLATRALIEPKAGELTLRHSAQFPLLRSAMESAALALWLLSPDDSRERIVRTLRARHEDVAHAGALVKEASEMIGVETHDRRSRGQQLLREATRQKRAHLAQLAKIAATERIAADEYEDQFPGYGVIIRDSTDWFPIGGSQASTVWRLISGFTQPSPLRSNQFSTFADIQDRGDDTLRVLSTSNPLYVLAALMIALESFMRATELFAARRITPMSSRPTNTKPA